VVAVHAEKLGDLHLHMQAESQFLFLSFIFTRHCRVDGLNVYSIGGVVYVVAWSPPANL
jgi:hypothetical protein